MAILKIARMGHPVLRRPALPIEDPTAPEVRLLAADMMETMTDAPGIGLAAPQVHVPRRLVVFYLPEGRAGAEDADQSVPLTVLVNPEIAPLSDEMDEDWEGCLSLPGMTGRVPRFTRIGYRALTLEGAILERDASGMHARVVQHECDHLDGMLYPLRMTDLSTFGFAEEVRRAEAAIAAEMQSDDQREPENHGEPQTTDA